MIEEDSHLPYASLLLESSNPDNILATSSKELTKPTSCDSLLEAFSFAVPVLQPSPKKIACMNYYELDIIQNDVSFREEPPVDIRIDQKNVLEVVDSKHRYSKNLRLYFREWNRVGRPDSFFAWIDSDSCIEVTLLPYNSSFYLFFHLPPTTTLPASSSSRTVRSHLPKLVEQVFVITHEKELEKAASCFLYEFDRNKDSDGNTVHEAQALRVRRAAHRTRV